MCWLSALALALSMSLLEAGAAPQADVLFVVGDRLPKGPFPAATRGFVAPRTALSLPCGADQRAHALVRVFNGASTDLVGVEVAACGAFALSDMLSGMDWVTERLNAREPASAAVVALTAVPVADGGGARAIMSRIVEWQKNGALVVALEEPCSQLQMPAGVLVSKPPPATCAPPPAPPQPPSAQPQPPSAPPQAPSAPPPPTAAAARPRAEGSDARGDSAPVWLIAAAAAMALVIAIAALAACGMLLMRRCKRARDARRLAGAAALWLKRSRGTRASSPEGRRPQPPTEVRVDLRGGHRAPAGTSSFSEAPLSFRPAVVRRCNSR